MYEQLKQTILDEYKRKEKLRDELTTAIETAQREGNSNRLVVLSAAHDRAGSFMDGMTFVLNAFDFIVKADRDPETGVTTYNID